MKHTLLLTCLIFLFIIRLDAQGVSTSETKGDQYFFAYLYSKAISQYNSSKNLTAEGQRKLAKSYVKLGQLEQADKVYQQLFAVTTNLVPEDYFTYSAFLKSWGKVEHSNQLMEEFVKLKPMDLRSISYQQNKSSYEALTTDIGKVKILHWVSNTDAADFGTCYYQNKVVFTSSRSSSNFAKKSNATGKPYLKMYMAETANNQLKSPECFDKSLDGDLNDGPASFNGSGSFMAFTRNNTTITSNDRVVNLQIFFRENTNGVWTKPISFQLNSKAYSVGHPCLTADGRTMYFTSDMPGGFGGTDIYRISRNENGEWLQAINLGNKINTEGDEMFPFFEENQNRLFFSSNGLFGLGGLDIFIANFSKNQIGSVANAGAPLNSKYDDFALITDNKMNWGYFSSNRIGGSGDDDIYAVDLTQAFNTNKIITGITQTRSGILLPNVNVALLNAKGEVIDSAITSSTGNYKFNAADNSYFQLVATKTMYKKEQLSTNTIGTDKVINVNIIMDLLSTPPELAIMPVKEDVIMHTIYFDLDKYTIRPDAAAELDKIVVIMNQNPSMELALGSYTDCRASVAYNQLLSEKRANASAEYIKSRITNPFRVTSKGYGKTKLVNACDCEGIVVNYCVETGHQKNRRTEFTITRH